MDLIISHAGCLDGWTAAYIAKKRYPEAEIVLLNHGIDPEPIINQCVGKDVIMLDYSLRTREQNDKLNSVAKTFHIYDHHKTAQAVLEGVDYATFDMKRSGAGLAWDYLIEPYLPIFAARPFWINYTEDQDLWNWALLNSKEINAYLQVLPRTIEAWDELTQLTPDFAQSLAAEGGKGVRKYVEYYMNSVIPEARSGSFIFEGTVYKTAVLNIPYAGVSEVGNRLVLDDKHDIALLWFERGDDIIQFSLRSNRDGNNVDVGAIAKSYGGGGHRNAAGFQMPITGGRKLVDGILQRGPEVYFPKENNYIRRSPGGCV